MTFQSSRWDSMIFGTASDSAGNAAAISTNMLISITGSPMAT